MPIGATPISFWCAQNLAVQGPERRAMAAEPWPHGHGLGRRAHLMWAYCQLEQWLWHERKYKGFPLSLPCPLDQQLYLFDARRSLLCGAMGAGPWPQSHGHMAMALGGGPSLCGYIASPNNGCDMKGNTMVFHQVYHAHWGNNYTPLVRAEPCCAWPWAQGHGRRAMAAWPWP